VNERRYHGAPIQFDVPRLLMLSAAQVKMMIFPLQALFGQTQAHLLGASGHVIVIQCQHIGSLLLGVGRRCAIIL
jgi:hypothetical protein